MSASVLVVDDEKGIGLVLKRSLEADSIEVTYHSDPVKGLRVLEERPFDLIITDVMMPEINGLTLLKRARRIRPLCKVLLMTGFPNEKLTRDSIALGAAGILTKPFSLNDDLKPLIREIFEQSTGPGGQHSLPSATDIPSEAFNTLCWTAVEKGAMSSLLETLPRIARSEAVVLIRGESGTGKELVATALHQLSPRAAKPFICLNCAAIPEQLLESELFGSVRGAFSGSEQSRIGLFEAASGGTLLLDEIGELAPSLQPKLLRVLQNGEFFRVGDSSNPIQTDVRVLAATNRNLEQCVETGEFRSDLYYRINVISLVIPPLRQRREQLRFLIKSFATQFTKGAPFQLSREAQGALEGYSWPGNVRELQNAIQHAVVLSDGFPVTLEHLPSPIQEAQQQPGIASAVSENSEPGSLEESEIRCILQALVQSDFNRAQAARIIGLTRRALGCRIQKYGLETEIESRRKKKSTLPFPFAGALDGDFK